MRRGEVKFASCGTEYCSGIEGRCLLCGWEYGECQCKSWCQDCPCYAKAETWRDISPKNVVMLLTNLLARPYGYFWQRWYS